MADNLRHTDRNRRATLKIPVILQPLLDAPGRDTATLLKQLQVGQVLPARVIAQVHQRLVRLQIASSEVVARTPVPLKAGNMLRLEVTRAGPLPELRILRPALPRDVRQTVVRSALTRQLSPAEVRQSSTAMRHQATQPAQREALQQFDKVLRGAGVSYDRIDVPQLRAAVRHSGLFHEALLLRDGAQAPADLKSQLLRLLVELAPKTERPAAPADAAAPDAAQRGAGGDSLLERLVRLIEGSVARVQLQQSTALPGDEPGRQAWQLDLPVHLPDRSDDVMMRIERDGKGEGQDGESGWSVNLAFQFDSIGTLQCRIGLNGDRVATTFWCERAATQALVEARLPRLRDALLAQGLEVVHLAGVQGDPPRPLIHTPRPERLLDEQA